MELLNLVTATALSDTVGFADSTVVRQYLAMTPGRRDKFVYTKPCLIVGAEVTAAAPDMITDLTKNYGTVTRMVAWAPICITRLRCPDGRADGGGVSQSTTRAAMLVARIRNCFTSNHNFTIFSLNL